MPERDNIKRVTTVFQGEQRESQALDCLDQSDLIDPTRYVERLPLANKTTTSTDKTRRVIRL